MTLDELFLILGVIMLSSGVVMAFRSSSSGVAFSYIGVSALSHSRYAVFNEEVLVFWAIAAVIVVVIDLVKRGFGNYPNLWKNYIVGVALAGMAVGLVYGSSGVSIGAIAGAVLGGLACRRAGGGSWGAKGFWRVVAAVGLPAVVTMTIVGIGIIGLTQKL